MIPAILGALIVWACVSTVPAIALGKLLDAPGACEPDPADPDEDVRWLPVLPPVPPSRTASDLPAWLFDQPTVPLTQGEMDRFEDLMRGAAA
jgi:hypothetical protein